MADQGFTLPVHYLRHMADQIRSMGGDVSAWLERSGLTARELDDPSLAIRYPVFERLVLNAEVVARERALGLFVGQRLVTSTHGILGYAAMNSTTVRATLELLVRFTRLRISLVAIAYAARGDVVSVFFDETRDLGEIQRPVLEAVMVSTKNIVASITLGACRIESVTFPFEAPEYAALSREIFGCAVRYGGARATLTMPRELLDTPLKMADPEAFAEAARVCQRELDKLSARETLASRVRRLLLERSGGFPSLQVTARLFHMTPRTLHRRLLDENTSYRALLEEVRHNLAVEQVKSGRSIEEIAYTLGYSDLANFRRAFKRWETVSPSSYRARHLRKPSGRNKPR